MPDISQSFSLQQTSENAWDQFIRNHPYFHDKILYYINTEHSIDNQRLGLGDRIVIINDEFNTSITLEVKTRHEKYHRSFLNDRCILFETNSNIELNRHSSEIYTSKSMMWAYGFYVGGSILDGRIYWTKPVSDYIRTHESRFNPRTSNTGEVYHTGNHLVPEREIKKFEIL